jgi:hypothetical protein
MGTNKLQGEWTQLDMDDLVAIQREVRAAIDATRKLSGKLRLQMGLLQSGGYFPRGRLSGASLPTERKGAHE